MPELTALDFEIFRKTVETGDLNIFTSNYFVLPYSGTWYREKDPAFEILYEAWVKVGKPSETINVSVDGNEIPIKVVWEGPKDPVFLHHHGYRLVPWAYEMVISGRRITVVTGGTGCGKTSSRGTIGLSRCALIEGYKFLNVAPTAKQATDMLTEVTKWVTNTPFEKFIIRTRDGNLFKQRPFPTMEIRVGEYSSFFGCMTVGQHGNWLLGDEQDEIHVDEAGLLDGIGEALPKVVTRLRGLRTNGRPRSGVIGFSTNPHDNASMDRLIDKAEAGWKDPEGMYFYANPESQDNVAVTDDQMELQMELIDNPQDRRRWFGGSRDALGISREIAQVLITGCHDKNLDIEMEQALISNTPGYLYETRDGMDVIGWRKPYVEERTYCLFGDPGTVSAVKMDLNNVPVNMVFDITDFPARAEMVVFDWIDGNGKYKAWKESTYELMLSYRCMGVYDGTSTQTAFAEDSMFEDMILWPISLAANNKALAKTMFKMFASDQRFAWPYIEGLWYQARKYRESGPGVKNLPDDILSALFVGSYFLRATFYSQLPARYQLKDDVEKQEEKIDAIIDQMATAIGRSRRMGGRRR